MKHARVSLTLCALIIAGVAKAGATPVFLLGEDQNEHLVDVSVADTDNPGTEAKGVTPDALGRYLVATCSTICPASGSYFPEDREDSFILTVQVGGPQAGNIYLTDFFSKGEDESEAEDNEAVVIPVFSSLLPGTPLPPWHAIINSPAEGAGDTGGGGGGGGGPTPIPEPSTMSLGVMGGLSFLSARVLSLRRSSRSPLPNPS